MDIYTNCMKWSKVEQFCGQCAVVIVAKDEMKKEGDHFNLIILMGEKKRKKSGSIVIDNWIKNWQLLYL